MPDGLLTWKGDRRRDRKVRDILTASDTVTSITVCVCVCVYECVKTRSHSNQEDFPLRTVGSHKGQGQSDGYYRSRHRKTRSLVMNCCSANGSYRGVVLNIIQVIILFWALVHLFLCWNKTTCCEQVHTLYPASKSDCLLRFVWVLRSRAMR